MTDITDLTETSETPTGLPDPRPDLATTTAQLTATIEAVRPDQLDLPTPCPDWTVRDLLAHLVGVADRITALGRGEVAEGEVTPPTVDDDGWAAAWSAATEGARRQWSDDDLLGAIVHPPFGSMPGAVALSVYVCEFTVHHWDLASALGVDVVWDEAIVAGAYAGTVASLPAEGRGVEVPFGEVVPVPDDAPTIDRLVAYLGRRP